MIRKPRVLIADDHADLVKTITRVLSTDCEISGTVSDGRAVLEAAERLRPDVIVLDLNLPNINGLEVCRQIAAASPHTRVVVFTALDDPYLRERALEAGASAFVCKVGNADLLQTINSLCVDRD